VSFFIKSYTLAFGGVEEKRRENKIFRKLGRHSNATKRVYYNDEYTTK
jgi:hypothetical protein